MVAHTVAHRTREIGIRLALGACTGDVLRMVVGNAMLLALTGVAVGAAIAVAVSRFIAGLLYGVSATDPATFVTIALLLLGVSFGASYIPARAATRIDPVAALRQE